MGKNHIITLIAVLCIPVLVHAHEARGKDDILVMFWNLENFFDWKDSGYSDSDREFSSYGQRHWTRGRFYTKCDMVAKTLLWIESRYGRIPDAVGVAEVENSFVPWSIAFSTVLDKYGYGVVHYESDDPRGIDVALLYRKDIFMCLESSPHKVVSDTLRLRTRDILHVALLEISGEKRRFDLLVNHHPSKYGGERVSYPKRIAAMTCLKRIADSLSNSGNGALVAMGDFNDTPDSEAFSLMEGTLEDKSGQLFRSGKGTIRYQGKWELIDIFMVSGNIAEKCRMEICTAPFLLVRDSSFPGMKPFRTYSGPMYNGGVSDHLPILLIIKENEKNL